MTLPARRLILFASLAATALGAGDVTLGGQIVTWTSSNAAVATVSASGLVTALAPGSATITATCVGHTGTAAIIVQLPVAGMVVTQSAATIAKGVSLLLTATPQDASGNPLTGLTIAWTSSDSTVATVAHYGPTTGQVTGIAPGTATITATSGGVAGTAVITVAGEGAVASITLSPDSAIFVAQSQAFGAPLQLAARATDANGTALSGGPVTWASSDTTVATVSASGLVTPNFLVAIASTATITATSEGKSAAVPVVVNPPVAEYVITPSTMSLSVGQTEQLTWAAVDSLGNPLIAVPTTWLNLKIAIATFVVNGRDSALVTASTNGLDAIYPYVTTTNNTFNPHNGVTITVGGLLSAARGADHPAPRARRAAPAIRSR